MVKRNTFRHSRHFSFPICGQKVTVSMMVGAIKAKVEELTDPTNEINRSSLGTAAAKATKTMNERILVKILRSISEKLKQMFRFDGKIKLTCDKN